MQSIIVLRVFLRLVEQYTSANVHLLFADALKRLACHEWYFAPLVQLNAAPCASGTRCLAHARADFLLQRSVGFLPSDFHGWSVLQFLRADAAEIMRGLGLCHPAVPTMSG